MKKLLESKMFFIKIIAILFLVLSINGCGNAITGKSIAETPPYENISLSVYFCPEDNCEKAIVSAIDKAKNSIHCAFYDLDIKKLIKELEEKSHEADVKVVIDKDNYENQINVRNIRLAESKQYMHNKFCILDGKIVLTGSMNPTNNDAVSNNNNFLVIGSELISKNYIDEFDELWSGIYSSGRRAPYKIINTNFGPIEMYFCPEDCTIQNNGGLYRINELVKTATESVKVAAFSFTHEGLGDELVKASIRGVNVTVVLESRQRNIQNSQYQRLKDFGINIKTDGNKYTMHHKFIIIDNKIIVTGSTNFSLSGNNKNDENMIIIFNKNAAELFLFEFNRLFDLGKS